MPKKKMSVAPLNISKTKRKEQEEQVKEIEQVRNKEGRSKSVSRTPKKSYLDALLGKVESLEIQANPIPSGSSISSSFSKKIERSIINSEIVVGQINENDKITSSDKDSVASIIKNGANPSFDGGAISYDPNLDESIEKTRTDSPLPIPVAELVISDADSVPSKVSSINADNDSVNNVDTIVPSVASDAKNQARPALKRRSSDESWVSSISAGSAGYEKVEKDDLSQTSKSQSGGYYR
jgi:hypothetical protein